MSGDAPLVILLVVALVLAVFLAAAEASLLRVSEFRIRALVEGGQTRAQPVAHLVRDLPRVLNLILLLALLAQIGAATLTGVLAQRWFGNVGVTIASILLTVVLFVYAEAIPKTYAVRHAERTAMVVAPVMVLMERAFRPLVGLLVWLADIQLPGKGITTSPTVTEEELKLLAVRAAREGEITEHDHALIERAFRFGDRHADDVMVPRPDVVAIDVTLSVDKALDVALTAGHRRLPVYEDSLDNIVGIVRLRDLVTAREQGDSTIEKLTQEPLVVPESIHVTSLLREMQENANHLAIVVDEYGVTAGLVTVEDIAEQLLGSITEQPGPPSLTRVDTDSWVALGSMPVEDLESALGLGIPEGEWNTVAGMMIGLAGRLLKPGESVDLGEFTLTVESLRRRRITRVAISRRAADPGSDT